MINEDTEALTWQQQAEIYQAALESALVYQQELESECIDLERQIEAIQSQHHQEIRDLASLLRATQEEHEASLHQRDQLISKQAKEIAHISHILQIQQRLLRSRQPDTK